jgi:hypothetical protein
VCWVACAEQERLRRGLAGVAGAAQYVLVICDGLGVVAWVCSMEPVGSGPATMSSTLR